MHMCICVLIRLGSCVRSEEEKADHDEADRLEHELPGEPFDEAIEAWNRHAYVEAQKLENVDHRSENGGQAFGVLDVGVVRREEGDRLKRRHEDAELGVEHQNRPFADMQPLPQRCPSLSSARVQA